MLGDGGDFVVSFCCYRDQRTLARANFLHNLQSPAVTQNRIGIAVVAGRDHHHGQLVIDERIGAMLQFSRRISFRVGVGNLFQFERAFAGDCVVHPTS